MSRRARKRRQSAGKRWLGKTLIALAVLLLLGIGAGYAALRHYLHSDGFRRFLSVKVGDAIGVEGEFAPFRWDGLAVDTRQFSGSGEKQIRDLQLDGLHTELRFAGIRRGVWELHGSRINRLDLEVDTRTQADLPEDGEPAPERTVPTPEEKSRWLPDKVELHGLDIADLRARFLLREGEATATGMRLRLQPGSSPSSHQAEIEGGTLRTPFPKLPQLELDRARFRYQDHTLFLTEASARVFENGRLSLGGEWDVETQRHIFEGNLSGIRCEELLDEDWSRRLAGTLATTFVVDGSTEPSSAHGSLMLENGVLTALPVLDALAAYADTRRFRVWTLSEARSDWRWQDGEIRLTRLVLASEGLARLEGQLTLRDRRIEGIFRLGIAPGLLSSIPGAETHVFLPGEQGLLWTPLRISGTLDRPREDLTERLIAAAGLRMFERLPETGEQVLRFTRSVVGDSSSDTIQRGLDKIEKGVEALEKNADAIREAGAILDGILNRKRRSRDDGN